MRGNDARRDLTLLMDAAEAAGRIAKRYFRQSPASWDKGGGAGPVTEADLAIDRMLKAELLAARPDYGWLSEESDDDPARLGAEYTFIVDPIDGTRAFVAGQDTFAHSIAVARNGVAVVGVVFLPIRDFLFAGAIEQGSTLNGAPIRATTTHSNAQPHLLTAKKNLAPHHWPGGVPTVQRSYRPSLAYRLALVGSGRFDGMVTFGQTWEWDVAAGTVIAIEAGTIVTDSTGAPVTFNKPIPATDGMIAAVPTLHTDLLARATGNQNATSGTA